MSGRLDMPEASLRGTRPVPIQDTNHCDSKEILLAGIGQPSSREHSGADGTRSKPLPEVCPENFSHSPASGLSSDGASRGATNEVFTMGSRRLQPICKRSAKSQ